MVFRSSSSLAHLWSVAGGKFKRGFLSKSFGLSGSLTLPLSRLSREVWGTVVCLLALVLLYRLTNNLGKLRVITLRKLRCSGAPIFIIAVIAVENYMHI